MCCMSGALRTQVYFTPELRARLDARAARDGTTLAQVVREAAGAYLAEDRPTVALRPDQARALEALAAARGVSVEQVVERLVADHLVVERDRAALVQSVTDRFWGAMPDLETPPRAEWDRDGTSG